MNYISFYNWIKEKEKEIYDNIDNESNKENLPNISNPYQTHVKGAPKKFIKSTLKILLPNIIIIEIFVSSEDIPNCKIIRKYQYLRIFFVVK